MESEELPSHGLRAFELEDPAFLSGRCDFNMEWLTETWINPVFLRVRHRLESPDHTSTVICPRFLSFWRRWV